MNEYRNQFINKSTNEFRNQFMNKSTNEFRNQYMSQSTNEFRNQYMNHNTNEFRNQYINHDMNEYRNQYMNQNMNEHGNQHMSQNMSEYQQRHMGQNMNVPRNPNSNHNRNQNMYTQEYTGPNSSNWDLENKDNAPLVVHKNLITSFIYTALFFLSSSILNLSNMSQSLFTQTSKPVNIPLYAITYPEVPLEISEEWKENQWENWKINLEDDWEKFHSSIENEKNKWLQGMELDWENWKRDMENKLRKCNEDMSKAYDYSILEKHLYWDESEWQEWIKSQGKNFMEGEWEKWIYENESYLNIWCMKKWLKWKNTKLVPWIRNEWKRREDFYWENWEKTWETSLYAADRINWLNWRKRNDREMMEWNFWVTTKEKLYINPKWDKLSEWKNNKKILFYDWMEYFINEWIRDNTRPVFSRLP
ncbi:tryptophan-rich protein [Plasmodium ovale]|uniref:Tryptophan-rich protein n=1 Tax=Plasmodium ovale TaxID=36330 RepID=A0A1D3JD91_PLAOA|nr:tryptophan-rich protein [Plasmodium ovale]